ncbi:MAG: DNA primase noncatalytic subunit PriX [Candidatus Micrarchaeota archaeon]|nr:DNA primase noncatalytic subunit PriX [Candidatus Micrarchaeota archaeon]
MQIDEAGLDFAYKYPCSLEARHIVASLNQDRPEGRYVAAGLIRINQALQEGRIEFTKTRSSDTKMVYLLSYVYSRMLVSAIGRDPINYYLVSKYAIAEARRIGEALSQDSLQNLARLGKELGISFSSDTGEEFKLPFYEYLAAQPRANRDYSLIRQHLEGGVVQLPRNMMLRLMEEAAKRSMLRGLPVDPRSLPKEILDASANIPIPKPKIIPGREPGKEHEWIEKLLEIPLPDFRHRSVNLILAPYFANVKNLDENQAVGAIMDYINRCKAINPHTDITESYVRYQVRYAKRRGLRPYSLERAKSLIGNAIDFGTIEKK